LSWAGVFFDLDGTLADTVDLILGGYRHTMRTHLGEVPPDERFRASMGRPLLVQMGEFARDADELERMRRTYMAYQNRRHDEMVGPYPGAASVLATLRTRGARLAVVTSKASDIARRTLDCCGLGDAIDVVVCSDQVERPKPDPESVLHALDVLGLGGRADQVVFVGDSPFDLQAGRAAGTHTAAALWGPFVRAVLEPERPDFFLESLAGVLRIAPRGA